MAHIHELIDFVVNVYIVCDKKVLLVKHKKLNLWLPVGGHIELDEDPEQALFREVKEECGLEIKLINKTKETSDADCKFLPVPNFLDIHKILEKHRHIAFEYVAVSEDNQVIFNDNEHTDFGWFNEDELKKINLKKNILFLATEAIKLVNSK